MSSSERSQVLRDGLASTAAKQLIARLRHYCNEKKRRYDRAYAIITNSMRQRRDVYGWVPIVLYDRSSFAAP